MTYRELPEEFPAGEDAPEQVTVLLDDDPLTLTDPDSDDQADESTAEITPDEPARERPIASGLWLGEWDGRPVSVRLAWTDRLVAHASARVGTDEQLVVLELTDDDLPTFRPAEGRYEFTLELRPDES
jgi:hypothetical protein